MAVTPIDAARSPLAQALRYARIGWHVFPLEPRTKKPLGRLVPQGHLSATVDEALVRQWWNSASDAGIGVSLAMSNLIAIDIDPRNGGIDTIDAIEAEQGALQSDVLAYTGGGGEHRVFSVPNGAALSLPGTLGKGVDIKYNGYIAVEPSIHPSGRTYEWEASSSPLDGVVPSPIPDWLRGRANVEAPVLDAARTTLDPATLAQLTDLQCALTAIASDDRDTWYRTGMGLHATGAGQPAFELWDVWSQRSSKYDAQDQIRVWRSFKAKGVNGIGPRSIFHEAQQHGWVNQSTAIEHVIAVIPATSLVVDLTTLNKQFAKIGWIVKHVIPQASVGVLFGASGAFKSFVALDLSLHLAHGLPWLGKRTNATSVVFVAAEGGAGIMSRVQAWHREYGLDWKRAKFYVCPHALVLSDLKSITALRDAIEQLGIEPGLIVVDTMSQTFFGNENDAGEVAEFFRKLNTELRSKLDASVLVVHHSGHSATERPRGSSAITANVDFMFSVFRAEAEMLCTLNCEKQKDGDRLTDIMFTLNRHILGYDEDGEELSGLAARNENSVAKIIANVKARQGSHKTVFLKYALEGQQEKMARKLFYDDLGEMAPETKKKSWQRCLKWALDIGLVNVVEQRFIVLREFGEEVSE